MLPDVVEKGNPPIDNTKGVKTTILILLEFQGIFVILLVLLLPWVL